MDIGPPGEAPPGEVIAMRRVALLVPLAFLFLSAVSAQPPAYPDWIRVKGAESLRCRIIGETPDTVEIETLNGRRQIVEKKDIEWIQREFPPPETGVVRRLKGR